MDESTSLLAVTGRRILNEALLAQGPKDLNIAAHRVIHALNVGDVTDMNDFIAGGRALSSRLVFGVLNKEKIAVFPDGPQHILNLVVLPDKNWRLPLNQRSPDATPELRESMRMKVWGVGIVESIHQTLNHLLAGGFRWSSRIQEALADNNVPVDNDLVTWLETHAAMLRAGVHPRH